MSELDQLKNGHLTDAGNTHHQESFEIFRRCLTTGNAAKLDRDPDTLALDTLDQLAKLLSAGEPSRKTLIMLADFLKQVSNEAGKSAHAWGENTKLAYRILGYRPNGRPTKSLNIERMLATFEMLKRHGVEDSAAERAAYNTYFEDEGRTYETDHLHKDDIGGAEFSKAEITMNKVIRPALRQAALVSIKPSGRPKGSKLFPPKPSLS